MNEVISDLTIERVVYSHELAEQLGNLVVHLTDRASGAPIDEETVRVATDSSTAEQLVAYQDEEIVGAATLTQLGGLMSRKAWLEDFVVAPEARGQGVADSLADEWEAWCQERNISMLMFTSGWQRPAAHKFYLRRGAIILNDEDDKTAFFNYPIRSKV